MFVFITQMFVTANNHCTELLTTRLNEEIKLNFYNHYYEKPAPELGSMNIYGISHRRSHIVDIKLLKYESFEII